MEGKPIGKIVKYFAKIGVAAIHITSGGLKVGDTIRIKGHTTDFEQVVESMQVKHENVERAETGSDVGIKVKEHVREQDTVYLVN